MAKTEKGHVNGVKESCVNNNTATLHKQLGILKIRDLYTVKLN